MTRKSLAVAATSLAAAAAIGFGSAAIATADTTSTTTPSTSSSSSVSPGQNQNDQKANGQMPQRGQGAQQGAQGAPGGQRMAPHQHTEVTGDEAQKVKDAIAEQNSEVTIEGVRKDEDGSYDAFGTKADGSRLMFDVSADLATVTEHVGGPGGRGGMGGPGGSQDTPVTGDEAQKVKDAVTAENDGATILDVRKDPDGSYDAFGTKADGTRVMFEVSADLATITENVGPQGGGRGGHAPMGPQDQAPGAQGSSNQGGAPTVQASPSA